MNQGDFFGSSVSISGDLAVVGASGAGTLHTGKAYVFLRNDAGTPGDASDDWWSLEDELAAYDADVSDGFGFATAISGDFVVVGALLDDDACPAGSYRCNSG